MESSVESQSSPVRTRRRMSRRAALLLIGLVAILASLGVRNSRWAHERRLKNLNVEDLSLAVIDDPNDTLAFIYYGSALLADNRAAESEKAFAHAVKLEPTNERAQLGVGSAQFRQGKLPDALDSFQKAINLNPKDTEAYLGLAQTYYAQGLAMHATDPLKKIVAVDPKSAPAWYFLGKMYGEISESDQALDAMQRAVKLSPTSALYWRDLGQLSRHYSRLDDAEQELKKSLHFAPNDPVAYLWLGQVYLQMGDTPKLRGQAEQCFEAAISRDPQSEEAYFGLGQLYQRSGNYSVAAARYRKACELDASDDKALHYEGECEVHLDNMKEGNRLLAAAGELESVKRDVDYLRKRMAAEPESRDLRLRLARLLRKYDDNPGALSQYAAYQNLGAEDPVVRKEMDQYENQLIARGVLPPRPGSQAPEVRR